MYIINICIMGPLVLLGVLVMPDVLVFDAAVVLLVVLGLHSDPVQRSVPVLESDILDIRQNIS